ncbi:MAG: hypothetical protein NTW52_19150 [Planctomycetota bacterium]|nr:hypothetical protein [Planctomycetota bacterium]
MSIPVLRIARIVGNESNSIVDLPLDRWRFSKHGIMMREMPGS